MSDPTENISVGQLNGTVNTEQPENAVTSNGTTGYHNSFQADQQPQEKKTEVAAHQQTNQADEKSKPIGEEAVENKRSFLQRHAFVITLIAFNMVHGLMYAVKGQYKYKFFHDMYADDLRHYNISRECGVKLEPAVQAIENKISANSAKWSVYGSYIRTPLTVIACFVIGMKSDQIGRRFIFLLPFVTSIAECIVIALVIRLDVHYGYMLIGDFVYALSGGSIGMYFASYSLVSDTHGRKRAEDDPTHRGKAATTEKPEKEVPTSDKDERDLDMSRETSRTFKLVLLSIVPHLAGSIVSFTEGYIIAYAGFFWSIILVIGFKSVFFIFGLIFVTETGEQKKSIHFTAPLRIIGRALKDPKRRVPLLLVNFGLLFSVLASVEEREIIHTYEMSPPFCLRSIQLGWLSAAGRLKGLFAIPLMWLWRRMRLSESSIAGVGIASYMAGALCLATIRETWVFYANIAVSIPGPLSSTMAKTISTRLIGRSALASTFAVMMATEELFSFVGGVASNYLYQYTLDVLPTAAFYLSACSFALASALYFAQTVYQWRTGDAAGADATLNIQSPTDSDQPAKA